MIVFLVRGVGIGMLSSLVSIISLHLGRWMRVEVGITFRRHDREALPLRDKVVVFYAGRGAIRRW